MNWLGFDIGGAHLKAADGRGFALERPFALWRQPAELHQEISRILTLAPPCDAIAVTMTGELADCYPARPEGVRQILQQVERGSGDRLLRVYRTAGDFVNVANASREPNTVAASNWHAMAQWAGRKFPCGSAVLIDIGSTTTDLIPLTDGQVNAAGATDVTRLQCGELVYTGVRRTPVATLVSTLPYRGTCCAVARETFATTLDVYLLLGYLPDAMDDCATADARPATRVAAHRRMARMLCLDENDLTEEAIRAMAATVMDAQLRLLEQGITCVLKRQAAETSFAILSGGGEFLARELLQRLSPEMRVESLCTQGNLGVAQCAPAHAVAVLAREFCR
tara:strand:- start:11341 stop:12351 length:1011 start_codon:yes stop_codon:yes gene_type:complete